MTNIELAELAWKQIRTLTTGPGLHTSMQRIKEYVLEVSTDEPMEVRHSAAELIYDRVIELERAFRANASNEAINEIYARPFA